MVFKPNFNSNIPRDNVDLLKEDQESEINEIHGAIANGQDDVYPVFAGGVKPDVAGIVFGMLLSFNSATSAVDVSKGVVYNRGRRGEFSSIQSVAVSALSVGDFLVARISYTDTYTRTNPVTHVNEATFRLFSCALVAKVLADLDDDDVILGKVTDITLGVPTFGDRAQWVYTFAGSTLSLFATDSAGADLYGPLGNNRFVRFDGLAGASVSTVRHYDSSTGFAYLNITLEKDSVGTVITTVADLVSEINTSLLYFRAEYAGTGTDVPVLLPALYSLYQQFIDGDDYRSYYEVVTGSNSLGAFFRFNTTDPYTKHLSNKGKGTPTENNPHALTLFDLGAAEVSTAAHIKREHYSHATLPRSVAEEFLEVTFPTAVSMKVQKSLSDDDVALISGEILKVSSDLNVSSPSLTFDLNDLYVNQAGLIARKVVATYSAATVISALYLPIQNGSACVLSIIDKKWDLIGDKPLYLTVTAGGTVFEAKFGVNGETVDVTVEGEYILRDYSDNSWIKIYRESEVLADGNYGNTVTYSAISDDLELPVALVFWKGSTWGYGGGAQLFIDMRAYGSFSVNNEKYLDLANTIPLEFRPVAKVAVFTAGSLDVTVNSFDIKFRGLEYRYPTPAVFTLGNSSTLYLCASFDERQSMTLVWVDSAAYVHVPDRVVLAKAVTDVTQVTSIEEMFYPGSFNLSDKCFEVNVSNAADLLSALESIDAFPAVYDPVINVRESFTFDMNLLSAATLDFGSVKIVGHGGTITFTDTTVSGKYFNCTGVLTLKSFNVRHAEKIFESAASDLLNCYFIASTSVSFIVTSGLFLCKNSSIGAVTINGEGHFSDVYVSKTIYVSASAELFLNQVRYTTGSALTLVTVTSALASFLTLNLSECAITGSNNGLISLSGTYAIDLTINMVNCYVSRSSLVTHTLSACGLKLNISNSFIRNWVFVHGDNSLLSVEQCRLYQEIGFKHSAPSSIVSSNISIDNSFVEAQIDVSDFTSIKLTNSILAASGSILKDMDDLWIWFSADNCDIVTECFVFDGNASTKFNFVLQNSVVSGRSMIFKNGVDDLKFSNCRLYSASFDIDYANTRRSLAFDSCYLSSSPVLNNVYAPVTYKDCVISLGATGDLCQYSSKVFMKDCIMSSGTSGVLRIPFTSWVFAEEDPSLFEDVIFDTISFSMLAAVGAGFNAKFSDCSFKDSSFSRAYYWGEGDQVWLDFSNCNASLTRGTESRLFFVVADISNKDYLNKLFKVTMDNVRLGMDIPTDSGTFYGGGLVGICSTIVAAVTDPHLLSDISLKNCHLKCASNVDLLAPTMNPLGQSSVLALLSTLATGSGIVGFGGFGVEVEGCRVSQDKNWSGGVVSFINGKKQVVTTAYPLEDIVSDTYYELSIDVDELSIASITPKVVFRNLVQEGGSISFLGFNFHMNLEHALPSPYPDQGHPFAPDVILSDISFVSRMKELFITSSLDSKISAGTDDCCINVLKATCIDAYTVRFLRLENVLDVVVNNCTNARFSSLDLLSKTSVWGCSTLAASNCSSQRHVNFIELYDRISESEAAFIVTNCTFKNIISVAAVDEKYIILDKYNKETRKVINGCSINIKPAGAQWFGNFYVLSDVGTVVLNDITTSL